MAYRHFPRSAKPSCGVHRRERRYVIIPQELPASFPLRRNLSLIDWPVVGVTGLCCLFLTAALTVIMYHQTQLVAARKERAAAIASTHKQSGSSTGDATTARLSVPADAAPAEHPASRPVEGNAPKYPEENPAAVAVAKTGIQEPGETTDILRQELRWPLESLIEEPGLIVQAKESPGGCGGDYGTSVKFVKDPREAFRRAGKENKIVFLLHLSGNFEDANFT